MKTMKLGKTGIDISRIGLEHGRSRRFCVGGDHELQTVRYDKEAPKAGANLIDTARISNFGNSEKFSKARRENES